MHRNCSIIVARIHEIERRIGNVHWEDKKAIAGFRKEMWSLVARCFNQTKYLKFAPGCDAEEPGQEGACHESEETVTLPCV